MKQNNNFEKKNTNNLKKLFFYIFAYILLQVNSVYFAFIIRSPHWQDCVFPSNGRRNI